jgi:hypothetical protein
VAHRSGFKTLGSNSVNSDLIHPGAGGVPNMETILGWGKLKGIRSAMPQWSQPGRFQIHPNPLTFWDQKSPIPIPRWVATSAAKHCALPAARRGRARGGRGTAAPAGRRRRPSHLSRWMWWSWHNASHLRPWWWKVGSGIMG